MSKTTKIIAALGVVAGLGVAALPAFSYATSTVAGQVNISAEVQEAIAMTIQGNYDDPLTNYISVGVLAQGIPVTGYYTYDEAESRYVAASGNADGTTEYFKQSATAVDVYTPNGASTIDGHAVGVLYDPLALQTSSSYVSLLPNDANTQTATSEITVYTNAASGFHLSVKDADSTTALTHTDGTSTIPAGTNITAGNAAWGYKVNDAEGFTAITANDVQIYNQSTPTGSGQTHGQAINVTYGVSTASDQKTGTYSDTIIYTATTNNSGN